MHVILNYTMEIASDSHQIHNVEEMLERFLEQAGLSKEMIDNLAIATTEMVNNAIHHGNRNDHNKKVHISFKKRDRRIEICIRDYGCGFDPQNVADPLEPENMFKDSGRGIFIVKSLMDEVKYSFTKKGTKVVMVKYL